MDAGFGAGDRPLGDQFLHEAVVDGDLTQLAVPQHVDARVADVGDAECFAVDRVGDDRDRRDGGAHPRLGDVVDRPVVDLDVGFVDGRDQIVEGVVDASRQAGRQPGDGHLAGHLACEVAAHSVGDDEQHLAGVSVVFVLGAELSFVGGAAPPQQGRHQVPFAMPTVIELIVGLIVAFIELPTRCSRPGCGRPDARSGVERVGCR